MVLVHKYYDGVTPEAGELQEIDRAAIDEVRKSIAEAERNLDNFHFREALKDVMNVARVGNKYLADTEPWKLIKTDPARTATILNTALQICANLAIVMEPFTPFMSHRLAPWLGLGELRWSDAGRFDLVPAGYVIAKPELLFERIDDSVVEAQVAKLQAAKEKNAAEAWTPDPVKAEVDFPTFEKMDIRVGKVTACEKVPKADKLLKLTIDDGMGGRTIVSGIAKYYRPEELVGQEVCFMANFAPRKLRGVESQGMVLSAVDADGRLVVVGPNGSVRPGASVG